MSYHMPQGRNGEFNFKFSSTKLISYQSRLQPFGEGGGDADVAAWLLFGAHAGLWHPLGGAESDAQLGRPRPIQRR